MATRAKLRGDGARYAALGFAFGDWFSLAAAWTTPLMPLLFARYGADRPLLENVLAVLNAYRDRALTTIGEAFIAASHQETLARERELHVTFDSIADAVLTTDDSAVIVRANRHARDLLRQGELVGRPLAEVWHPRREPAGLEPEDLRLLRPDGTSISVSKSRAPIARSDGTTRGEVIVFRDVSVSRRRALELARWEALFQGIGWGIAITDSTGNLAQCNRAFLRMYGFDRHDPPRTLESLADQLRVWRDVAPLATETGTASYEAVHRRADGSTFPVQVEALRIPDVDHQSAWAVSIRDLTERRQVEALQDHARALEDENRHVLESSRLKSEFLANMSHELRTPLNSILGFSELLHNGEVGPLSGRRHEFLGDIHTSGKHLLRLINDILDLSKIEAGKIEFYPEEVLLADLVTEVVGVLHGVAHQRSVLIEVSIEPSLDVVLLDPARLKQVLYNYLSNAIKFTPVHGSVHLRLKREGATSFRIEVEDHGPGIAAANLSRLFTEFDQLDAGRTKSFGGTGLGLALTRRLVDAQQGRVGVDSVVGQGCVFHAVLPLRSATTSPLTLSAHFAGALEGDPEDQPQVVQKPLREGAALGRTQVGAPGPVLVIDDDDASVRLLGGSLTQIGIDFVVARNGLEGLERAAECTPSCVILDLVMPVLDGFGFLVEFRRRTQWAHVPVLVWTTKDLSAAERTQVLRSASGVLAKDGAGGAALLDAMATYLPGVRAPSA